jgi:hypothetical protein
MKLFEILSGKMKDRVKEFFENYLSKEKSSFNNLIIKSEFFDQTYMDILSAKNSSNYDINKKKNHNPNHKIKID